MSEIKNKKIHIQFDDDNLHTHRLKDRQTSRHEINKKMHFPGTHTGKIITKINLIEKKVI